MLFVGPLVGMLCDRFSCRKVVFVGAVIAGLGWTISAFSNGILYLYFSLGIVAGMYTVRKFANRVNAPRTNFHWCILFKYK